MNFDDLIREPAFDQGCFETALPINNNPKEQQDFLARKKIEEILEMRRQRQYIEDF